MWKRWYSPPRTTKDRRGRANGRSSAPCRPRWSSSIPAAGVPRVLHGTTKRAPGELTQHHSSGRTVIRFPFRLTKINFVFSWSNTGKFGFPQPDNREFREIGRKGNENCLALLVGAYGEEDSIEWHDKTHFQRYDVICEDSDSLLKYARAKFRGRQIPA